MDTKQFLGLVLPTSGPYLLAEPASFVNEHKEKVNFFKHYRFNTLDEAAAAIADSQDIDLYFALASFISVPEDLEKKPGQKGVRVGTNVLYLRSLWMDIDVKPAPKPGHEGNSYTTLQEAWDALKKFVIAMSLPRPHVVQSGGGLHVYWPLAENVHKDVWLEMARILKALTVSFGLRADPSRTADCASVLRPVGSNNWKTGTARPVQIAMEGTVVSSSALKSHLAMLAEKTRVPVNAPAPKLQIAGTAPTNAVAQAAMDAQVAGIKAAELYTDADGRKVVERCQQLRWQATHQSDVEEHQWYDMVGCLRHTNEGRKVIMMMSVKHPDFTEEKTDKKIQQLVDKSIGPTLCTTFETHRPGGCEGCLSKGRIKSPITLGRELKSVPAPVAYMAIDDGPEEQVELPEPPHPFKRAINPSTGQPRIMMYTEDKEDTLEEIEIYPYDIYPVRRTFNQRDKRYTITLRAWLPKDGWQEFEVNGGMMYNTRAWSELLGNMGVMVGGGHISMVVEYMIGYIRQLQEKTRATVLYAQLGWAENDTRFVLPGAVVTAGGVLKCEAGSNIENTLTVGSDKFCASKGSLDAWKQAVTAFNTPGWEPLLFMFGTGFGAPLFRFTGFASMIVNANGKAGSGKTLSLRASNTIWGRDESHWISIKGDTYRAAYQKLGTLGNLPAYYDEITDLPPDELGPLCYSISQGRGRQRLRQNGEAAENFGSFSNLVNTTSNGSLLNKLGTYKSDSSAESVRVFEFDVPEGLVEKAFGTSVYDALRANFGLAGPIFAAGLLRDPAKCEERVRHWVRYLDAQTGVTSAERFWTSAAAAVIAGFELANKLELTKVDLRPLVAWAITAIKAMRVIVIENTRTPVSTLDEYLRSELQHTLTLSMPTAGSIPMVVTEPRGELRIRYEQWSDKVYIDRAHFRRFCVDKGIDFNGIRDALTASKVLISDQLQMRMGKDTVWKAAQTRCWVVDMAHPLVADAVAKPNLLAQGAVGAAAQAIQNAQKVTP